MGDLLLSYLNNLQIKKLPMHKKWKLSSTHSQMTFCSESACVAGDEERGRASVCWWRWLMRGRVLGKAVSSLCPNHV